MSRYAPSAQRRTGKEVMLTKENLSIEIRTLANQIAQEVTRPRGEWDSFVLELRVSELATMVRIYREMPHNR